MLDRTVADDEWAHFVAEMEQMCDMDADSFAHTVAGAHRLGDDGPDVLRVGVEHVCPDRLDQFDETIAALQD